MTWKRWWPITGVVYAVAVAVALLSGGSAETDAELLAFYAESSNRTSDFVLFFLLVVAGLCLLTFAAQVRERLAPEGPAVRLVAASAVASATLLLATAAVWVSISAAYTQDGFRLDPNTARLVGSVGYGLFTASMMCAGLLAASLVTAARRAGLLPSWIAWSGFAAAALLVAAYVFVPVLLFLLWMLAASIALIARRAPANGWSGSGRPV
jgi:hypothetical protein